MARNLTASDRSALIRLASAMPVGSDVRRAILAGLKQARAPRTASLDGLEYDDSLAYKIFGASLWKLYEKGTLNRNQYRKVEEALEKCLKRVLS